MSDQKPLDEYYLHDHGEGNGWQILTKGPEKWGVNTQGEVDEADGVIGLTIDRYWTGGLGTSETDFFVLSPEEALDIGNALITASKAGYDTAFDKRLRKIDLPLNHSA